MTRKTRKRARGRPGSRTRRGLDRRGLRILVTAGPTREYLDPVRYLSNDSTGRMGFAIAAEALRRGHNVTLVHGPVALTPPAEARLAPIVTAAEMLSACRSRWPRHDLLIMCAAVADYRPVRVSQSKVKKSPGGLMLALEPTVDVLAELSKSRKAVQRIIGFALEDRNARENARLKLERKGLDAIVLNAPAAIGRGKSKIEILRRDGEWAVHSMRDKSAHAGIIIDLAESIAHTTADSRSSRLP